MVNKSRNVVSPITLRRNERKLALDTETIVSSRTENKIKSLITPNTGKWWWLKISYVVHGKVKLETVCNAATLDRSWRPLVILA